MTVSRLEYLFSRYISNDYTAREEEELMDLLARPGNEALVQSLIDKVIENTGSDIHMPDVSAASILQRILQQGRSADAPVKRKISFRPWLRAAAAVALLLMAISAYWLIGRKATNTTAIKAVQKQEQILPGGEKALLTMSDGSVITLDSVQNTMLQQGNTRINKQGGLLVYHAQVSSGSGKIAYNTLSTPRGGQYQVILPDGSRVWLNAASSLRFPTAFTGNERKVALTGEAYFEVAKDNSRPFRVMAGNMQVNVLGTQFNVNAYPEDGAIRTSLLEGSVRITNGNVSGLLRPGQQAVLDREEGNIKIKDIDMSGVVAWKNGLFQFEGADIITIMREISRWYDVEVTYAGKVPVRRFEGKISRNVQLSDVLQILELSNVKFMLEGRKIIVQ